MSLALRECDALRNTTAGTSLRTIRAGAVIVGLFPLSLPSTAATYAAVRPDTMTRPVPQWPIAEEGVAHPAVVHRLRLISGLTWEEMGVMLGVSRRTVHNWANGEAIKPVHAEHLRASLRSIEAIQRASSTETRQSLLGADAHGICPLDLLARRDYAEAIAAALAIKIRSDPALEVAQASPVRFLGALTEPVAPATGPALRGRSKRVPRTAP